MTDLDLIAQLEQRLGKKLAELEEIEWWWNSKQPIGYQLTHQQQIIGLSLHDCELTEFPAEIAQLQNLQILSLNSNQLSALPAEIAQLQNLRQLELNSNQLSVLPAEIAQLQNLQVLGLDSNQLGALPAEIAQLQNLQALGLDSNQLSALPADEIAQLQKLERLYLNFNQLSALPAEIAQLQYLRDLGLKDNPLKTPPYEIAREGMDAIRVYFNALGNAPQSVNELKVILVGEGASGKTSLVKRLFNEAFDQHEAQTHGINIRDWTFSTDSGRNIRARLWDFGGQQIMHATHQFFLSKRSLYLLVLDGRKEEKTEYWLQHIEALGGKSPTLVILNKIDENPGFEVNRRFLTEKYPFIIDFYRISCCKNDGIDALKTAIQRAASQVEILQTLWPRNWLAVKQALEQKNQEKVDYIPYDSYLEVCRAHDIDHETFQHTLIKFLHDLGVVIHFREALLEETNVINPEWVTDAVYKIVTSQTLADRTGIIAIDDLKNILDSARYPSTKRNYIVGLMKKFELCYELDRRGEILVPDLLPVQEPDFTFNLEGAIRFVLQYEFLPKTIMAKFIVKMHRDIKQELRWRTGVILEDQHFAATARVKADDEAKKIFIDVNGQQKREYFAALLYMLRDIHQIFAKMDPDELIRLPDNPDETVGYKRLINLEQRGKTEYSADTKDYRVGDLLGTVRNDDPTREMMSVLRKLSEQMLTQEEFLKKVEHFFEEQAKYSSRGELSEETAQELGLGIISEALQMNPRGLWRHLQEIHDRIWKIK